LQVGDWSCGSRRAGVRTGCRGWWRVSGLRPIAIPFVAAAPAGARVRARLRASEQDEAVLRAVGMHLGSLAGRDLAARCAEGRLDVRGQAVSRAARTGLQARIRRIEARLAAPAGGRIGRVRGYATLAERHAKAIRLRTLKTRLARVDRQVEAGTASVVRGGKALLRKRGNLDAAGMTEDRWRAEWEIRPAVFDRGRGEGQAVGQRDDSLAPRRGLAGGQAPGATVSPGKPAARPVPALVPGGVLLPRR
jgi:hypothetical protein